MEQFHLKVNHSLGEYARDGIHVNNVENFLSLLKCGIMGSFHHVSEKRLQRNVDEFCWRFNNRHNKDIFSDLLGRVVC
ncbi:MAG: transposase [Leptospirales bacterium]